MDVLTATEVSSGRSANGPASTFRPALASRRHAGLRHTQHANATRHAALAYGGRWARFLSLPRLKPYGSSLASGGRGKGRPRWEGARQRMHARRADEVRRRRVRPTGAEPMPTSSAAGRQFSGGPTSSPAHVAQPPPRGSIAASAAAAPAGGHASNNPSRRAICWLAATASPPSQRLAAGRAVPARPALGAFRWTCGLSSAERLSRTAATP
jgi:hypothetical protein